MKISSVFVSAVAARQINVNDFQRNLSGNYLDSLVGIQERGYFYGDATSLHGLATMVAFMQPPKANERIGTIQEFDFTVADFVDKFTNYGCYCWILGADKGVIGGGQTRDQIDGLCGQLYKCYKCINLDHGSEQSSFNYDVSLVQHQDGRRELECKGINGPNVDACKCDKMFAERLSDITSQCNSDLAMGITDSPYCPNEAFRTQNGGGDFNPFDSSSDGCLKNGGDHHAKDGCCGEYPDRMPYDSMNRQCCRSSFGEFSFDRLVPFGTCEERGGEVLAKEDS